MDVRGVSERALLRSYEFRREREPTWQELEGLLKRVSDVGLRSLTAAELSRLPHLYRAALSSLSVARAISLDKNVVDYLENLAARAYFCVYGTRRHLLDTLRRFVVLQFPAAVRRLRWHIAIATALLVLGTVVGFWMTVVDPDRFYSFVSADYAQGRGPASSTAELRAVLYDSHSFGESLVSFASALFTHNARIGILAFALGFVVGAPTVVLAFINGLTLGAFGALYHSRGLSADFWGWVLPHGVTELGAVCLCVGGGLALAQAMIAPGRRTRLDSLARRGRRAGLVVIGAVIMFLIAGLIEGWFRQLVQSVPIRYTVAGVTFAAWGLYLGLAGRSVPVEEDE